MHDISLEIGEKHLAALRFEGQDRGQLPILALHGWLDNAASFIPISEHLAGPMVALDLPGHGASPHRPLGIPYHFIDYLYDVLHALDALQWPRCILVGHSLGAGLGALFAAVFPERVEKLIMLDGLGPVTVPRLGAMDDDGGQASMLQQLRKSMEQYQLQQRGRRYADLATLVMARQRAGQMAASSAELLMKRNSEELDGGFRLRTDPRLRRPSPLYLAEVQVLAFLRAISAPTLLVAAQQGVMQRFPQSTERFEAIGDLTISHCEGYHHVHMDEPAYVAGLIADWL